MNNFNYDPLTGKFTWAVVPKNGTRKIGDPAGTKNPNGYVYLSVDGKHTSAHRYAWFLTHGKYPDGHIDHIDGNPSNNAISNLRDTSALVNSQNKIEPMSTNKTGYLGVYYDPKKDRYRGEIIVNKRRHRLGWFKTAEEASAAYIGAKAVLHPESFIAMNTPTVGDIDDYGEGCMTFKGDPMKNLPTWLK